MFVASFTLFCRLWSKPACVRPTERRSFFVSGGMSVFGTARGGVDEDLFFEFWRDRVFWATFSSTVFNRFSRVANLVLSFPNTSIAPSRMLLICEKSILPLVCTAVVLISGFVETPAPLYFSSPPPLDLGTRGMIFDP